MVANLSSLASQAYIAKFLQQREENKAATLAAARAEDQKIKQYWSMVSRANWQALWLFPAELISGLCVAAMRSRTASDALSTTSGSSLGHML
jgi:hypothetical protein